MNEEWTPRDIDILRREYPVRECEEVAAMLGRTTRARRSQQDKGHPPAVNALCRKIYRWLEDN